ncbi:DNA-directed RNA polymerase III subunit 1 [Impatiens glandulifera]|uniref:DNA-directed RNA polymerase III subunit 1 n=1 Tax=Impatiens glandulifera TaxID=253017 RepID=UPI001FB0C10A|nr:DNA-directed RNA polymerase III subunit 1 [Impatiens glandulifera]
MNRDQQQQQQNPLQFTKEPYIEDIGPQRIQSITFSMFSEDDIMNLADVQVHLGAYYDVNKKPKSNGLVDNHMGPPNKKTTCLTCNGSYTDCPGHYGYLSLTLPVYNIGYLPTVILILKCICKSCSRVLLHEKDRLAFLKKMRSPKMEPLRRTETLKGIVKKCNSMTSSKKAVTCSRCGYINGMVKRAVGSVGVIYDRTNVGGNNLDDCKSALSHTKDSKSNVFVHSSLYPDKVLSLFKKMSDEDCELLYLSDRPEKLIFNSIAVPPVAIRPSVFQDGSAQSNENDISERLKRIIQANASLQRELEEGKSTYNLLDAWNNLQIEVALYINSEARITTMPMQTGRPLNGFTQRLNGKQGRFRGNLSGKRVEYTGRTVISPDPNLKITEVAIPILMAKILTFPDRVSRHNIEKLRQCVLNGPDKYPGARLISRSDTDKTSLACNFRKRHADNLEIGNVVHRHLEDGDVVLFNRQPSLHRMSIMSHRARIMPWRTLRFNESVCNPYNADFDGDEMNMHVPQTEEARTEALLLMGVQNNLCTPKNGEILVASTQDFLTTSFLVTRKDTFYDRATFSFMCSYMVDGTLHNDLPSPALIKPVELWTGKQLFSVLVRSNAETMVYLNLTVPEKNYVKKTNRQTMCPNDGFVYFRNSELLSGQLGKATLGNGTKDGLYSVLLRDYSSHAAAECMNRVSKLSARWIGNHGFSIGIDDVKPGDDLIRSKKDKIDEGYGKCDELIQSYNKDMLKLQFGCNAAQTLEAEITGVLNTLRDSGGEVCMEQLHWRNSPLIMSQCGSKGSPMNITQMVLFVGQQSVGGRRAPDGFISRSLPHFPINSKTPSAKGFVANSFYSGLSATEFFFHTMGGREGLVDTAVKTADTGYMSRKLIKALEDLSVQYDNTVRNASGTIIQFLYGDDGMDPSQMEGQNGFPLNFDRLLLKAKATCPAKEDPSLTPLEMKTTSEAMISSEHCSDAFKKSLSDFIEKLGKGFEKSRNTFNLKDDMEIEGQNGEILDNAAKSPHGSQVSENNYKIIQSLANNISGISAKQLQVFLRTCLSRYSVKNIECGTAIGAIGAQSIGEPGTQMTLKTFHFAGVASMNVTLGVPRIKEIISAAKKISTPIITAVLNSKNCLAAAKLVSGCVGKTVLGQIAKCAKSKKSQRSGSIFVTLNMEKIEDLYLGINTHIVKEAILRTPRIQLKGEHIKILDGRKLEIIPPQTGRTILHFQLDSLLNKIVKIVVKGISTVDRAVITKSEGEYQLVVSGFGLRAVMGMEGIDGLKTTSNHIMELREVIGIEAARSSIIEEIKFIMEKHKMTIDQRHMMLLADLMTYKGEVLGITRYGVQKMKDSVLSLASFEKTTEHLYNGSVNGREDLIEGVSECIIMGIPIPFGTGMIKVRQKVESLPVLKYGLDPLLLS